MSVAVANALQRSETQVEGVTEWRLACTKRKSEFLFGGNAKREFSRCRHSCRYLKCEVGLHLFIFRHSRSCSHVQMATGPVAFETMAQRLDANSPASAIKKQTNEVSNRNKTYMCQTVSPRWSLMTLVDGRAAQCPWGSL